MVGALCEKSISRGAIIFMDDIECNKIQIPTHERWITHIWMLLYQDAVAFTRYTQAHGPRDS